MGSKLYLACLIQHMLPKRQGGHPGEALIILELPRLITVDWLGYWRLSCWESRPQNICTKVQLTCIIALLEASMLQCLLSVNHTCAASLVKGCWTGSLNAGTDLETAYMITAEAHNSTLWLYCDLKKYMWSIIIMKHSISFIHISEKNLTFEGISDAIEYDFIFVYFY